MNQPTPSEPDAASNPPAVDEASAGDATPSGTAGDSVSAGPPAGSRTARAAATVIAILALAAVIAILAVRPLSAFDLGWNLRTGEWIVTHGSAPDHEPFLYTSELPVPDVFPEQHEFSGKIRAFVLPLHWLGQVTMYGFWWAFGDLGLVIFRMVFFVLFLLGVWLTCRQFEMGTSARLFVLACAVTLAAPGMLAKPNIITYAMTSLSVFAWTRLWRTGRARWGWVAAGLLAVWTQMHGGFVYGVALAVAWIVGLLGEKLAHTVASRKAAATDGTSAPTGTAPASAPGWPARPASRTDYDSLSRFPGADGGLGRVPLGHTLALAVITLVLPLFINPGGLDLVNGMMEGFRYPAGLQPQEHMAPDYLARPTSLLTPLLLLIALLPAWRRLPMPMIFMMIGSTLAVISARRSAFFAAAMLPAAAAALSVAWFRVAGGKPRWHRVTPWLATSAVVLLCAVTFESNLDASRQRGELYLWSDMIPIREARFLQEHPPPGRPYNGYGQGGTLVWFAPDVKWFYDGRNLNLQLNYVRRRSFIEYSRGNSAPLIKMFRSYGIKWALMPLSRPDPGHAMLTLQMIKSGRWQPAGPVSSYLLVVNNESAESKAWLARHAMSVEEFQASMALGMKGAMKSALLMPLAGDMLIADYLLVMGAFDDLAPGTTPLASEGAQEKFQFRRWLQDVASQEDNSYAADMADGWLRVHDQMVLEQAVLLSKWKGGEAYARLAEEIRARISSAAPDGEQGPESPVGPDDEPPGDKPPGDELPGGELPGD